MAKRKRDFTSSTIQKRLKEGRGQGEGIDYLPWLYIQDVPSEGRATRMKGWTTGRMHHLMSDLERDFFYLLDFADHVADIREQYPLLPLEETLAIADKMGVKHPTDPYTGEPVVMTTDFLVTYKNKSMACSVKPADHLGSTRTIDKLEIEKRYWQERYIEWKIVTDRDIPKIVARNIEWFHKDYENEDMTHISTFVKSNLQRMFYELLQEGESLARAASFCDEKLGFPLGTSLAYFKHLLARKYWVVDMNVKINPSLPVNHLQIMNMNETLREQGGS